MKKIYISPRVKLTKFDTKDVITTSGVIDYEGGTDEINNSTNSSEWLDIWDLNSF